jgi:hypothetical protein
MAEIFLQYFEDIHVKQLMDTKNIIFYTRYVDDILIVYDTKRMHPDLLNTYINQIHMNIKLNPTYESNGHINFLDLLIIRKTSNLKIDMFQKPTTTDTTVNFLSNHPTEHKVATFRCHITRMHLLPLTPQSKQKEWTVIQLTARNNSFPQNLLHKLNLQIKDKKTNQGHTNDSNTNKSWTTFMYYSPKIGEITNLFKHTNVKVAFRNTSTLQQPTKPKTDNKSLEQDKSEIYELTHNTCHMSYIGQTSHCLKRIPRTHQIYKKQ